MITIRPEQKESIVVNGDTIIPESDSFYLTFGRRGFDVINNRFFAEICDNDRHMTAYFEDFETYYQTLKTNFLKKESS